MSDQTVSNFSYGKLIDYADLLSSTNPDAAKNLIIGLWRYFPFIGSHHKVEEVLDIAESSMAMETLYDRVAEWHGEVVRDDIFKGIERCKWICNGTDDDSSNCFRSSTFFSDDYSCL